MHFDDVPVGIEAEHLGPARCGADFVEEYADGGGFSCAVGAEEAEHLADVDLDVDSLQGLELAVVLDQLLDVDGGHVTPRWGSGFGGVRRRRLA